MKNICKITALLAAVLMLFCVTGCGDNAGGTPAEPPFNAQETPLTLEAIAAGEITLTHPWPTLKYKKNGDELVGVTASANTIAVAAGDKIAFYAGGSENTDSTYLKIECSADCYVYGNVMSLLSSSDFRIVEAIPNTPLYTFEGLFYGNTHIKNHAQKALVLPATTLTYNCYENMFNGCTGLTSAPALPAETLEEWCYASMFRGCTGLTNAPELPATSMWDACYDSMFRDCTGLTIAPTLPATDLAAGCYSNMFNGCTGLTSAPDLPATALANGCYEGMFSGCTSLASAPALPATTLAASWTSWASCYSSMFSGCTSLTSAPALPATTLAASCYSGMFSGCTGLTSAPVLPATALAASCYSGMFSGCTSLSSVTCLATNISATDCTTSWLDGVAATGTFKKASSMSSWITGASGIPSGWEVQDYSAQ